MLSPRFSLSLAGLPVFEGAPWSPGPKDAIAWAATLRAQAVQLDATAPSMRPRELDRSARRDVAAVLRRHALEFSGLDLWIPPVHFTDPSQMDRAAGAVLAAAELAADLATLTSCPDAAIVSFTLDPKAPDDLALSLRTAADRFGTTLADHVWPMRKSASPNSNLAFGLDPATLLLAGADPVLEVTRLADAPASARLSDANSSGRTDSREGGRLDTWPYFAALATRGYARPVIIDLRGLRDPNRTAQHWLLRS